MIEILKILLCLPFLLYSCYADLKTRRVSNKVWAWMLACESGFILYELSLGGLAYFWALLLSSGLGFLFIYLLFQFRAFGGADAKALIVLFILFPLYPSFKFWGLGFPLLGQFPMGFSFTVLCNALFLTVTVPLGLFLYNLLHFSPEMLKKPFYMFIGYRAEVSALKEKRHHSLLERFEELESGEIKKSFARGGLKLDAELSDRLSKYAKKGLIESKVWVTPALPFMLSITAGFLSAVAFGNLIFYFVLKILF